MTHRGEMVWLDVMDSTEKIKEKVESNLFDIYPVASGKFDDFLGIVYLKDLFLHIDSPDFNMFRRTKVSIQRWNSLSGLA